MKNQNSRGVVSKGAGMNLRKWLLFSLVSMRGQHLGEYYEKFLYEARTQVPKDTTYNSLINLFHHCEKNVPYYSRIMSGIETSYEADPVEYLNKFPILTRDLMRDHFDELKSKDLSHRHWYLNSTGGSSGEPAIFIQDWDYASKAGAIKLLFSRLVGKEIGEREIKLWGNLHDIKRSSEGFRANLVNIIKNLIFINSQYLTPQKMVEIIKLINRTKPKLIVSYAEPIYELAKFADREKLNVLPQSAIMTSAFKLYPFMRQKIESVFQCKVFDRYGSREFGDIACERPGVDGLWVAPWGNYLEIVDPDGNRVPDGVEGDILVTSLTNYAMPLIRYKINDRGVFACGSTDNYHNSQIVSEVIGRSSDFFKTKDNGLIVSGYFMAQLYFRDWISQYQIIQKSLSNIVYRIVKFSDPPQSEIEDIIKVTKKVMGNDCSVSFEYVDKIPSSSSGKFKFLLSEIQ